MTTLGPIGVFDSGYGGLTVLADLRQQLPEYDFLYLGDNARAPYGSRSFDRIYTYTLEAVEHLFAQGCSLVILACNTASARALRTIQQKDLPRMAPNNRVLGIIRPMAEYLGQNALGAVGVVATQGTVRSESYPIEIAKQNPKLIVAQQACPMWATMVENRDFEHSGGAFYIQKDLAQLFENQPQIRELVLGCTHYPLLMDMIRQFVPSDVRIHQQGPIVAQSLVDYLHRHPEMALRLSRQGQCKYQTTEDPHVFAQNAAFFMASEPIVAEQIRLGSKN
jgi:glutamate racemase